MGCSADCSRAVPVSCTWQKERRGTQRVRTTHDFIAIVIAVVAIGIGYIAVSIGIPFWISAILTVIVTAIVGLFMFLNLV